MTFRSILGSSAGVSFRDALLQSLAPDGSLYVPETLHPVASGFLGKLESASLQEIGEETLRQFVPDIPGQKLQRILNRAWTFPVPLRHLEDGIFLLELFHGPTLAFKDVGARFMALALSHFLLREERHATLAVATSGDTGSAVAHGFRSVPRVAACILYPSGKISALQERQMTTVGGNVCAIEVEGSFDDCQLLVKQALMDPELVRVRNITTANSINIARLLPQIAYYGWGIAQLFAGCRSLGDRFRPPVIVVPSGNLGNLTAAAYAKALGFPIRYLVAATNANDVFADYLHTGSYQSRTSVQTLSNAMDVGNPSNLGRLQALFHHDIAEIRRVIRAYRVSDAETLEEIRHTRERTGVVLDPHSAVGVCAARRHLRASPGDSPVIVGATAHPGKFPEVIERALGQPPEIPGPLQKALQARAQSIRMPCDYAALRSLILDLPYPD